MPLRCAETPASITQARLRSCQPITPRRSQRIVPRGRSNSRPAAMLLYQRCVVAQPTGGIARRRSTLSSASPMPPAVPPCPGAAAGRGSAGAACAAQGRAARGSFVSAQHLAVLGQLGEAGGEQPPAALELARGTAGARTALRRSAPPWPGRSPAGGARPPQHGQEDRQEDHAEGQEQCGGTVLKRKLAARCFSSRSSTDNSSMRVWRISSTLSSRPRRLADSRL